MEYAKQSEYLLVNVIGFNPKSTETMKPIQSFISIISLLLVCSCEGFQEEEQVVCLPTNMTATIVQGGSSTKIIADFHYVPETDLLDHITWNNHQTHYFEYDAIGRLSVVRQMKVKEKVQEEMWFEYEGAMVSLVVIVKKNLDYSYLEPVDSAYVGHIAFDFEGKDIVRERLYEVSEEGGNEILVRTKDYAYDAEGNILSSTVSYPGGNETAEIVEMTYDTSKHPFSALRYYFNGESFVNNLMSKSSGIGDTNYQYDLRLNSQGYPEIIYETLGSSNTRIIRYSYLCL
jgi:hypothetical protein